jgi:hypothetical protein
MSRLIDIVIVADSTVDKAYNAVSSPAIKPAIEAA